MKKRMIISFVLVTLSQTHFAQTPKVLTELITYRVNLRLDGDLDATAFTDAVEVYYQMNDLWYANKLGPLSYETLVKQLHADAISGKLQVYDPMLVLEGAKPIFTRMTKEEVAGIGVDTMEITMMRPYPPYEEYDSYIVKEFDLTDIAQIEFMEKWTINTKTMQIKKEIIAYSLLRKIMDLSTGEFRGMSRMYWIKCK